MPRLSAFARFAWGVLAWNVAVVLWGAYVRASGSGAGCGRHWPVCNGQVIPHSPSAQTLIELTHRAMTGIDSLLVLALLVLAWRLHPRASAVRRGAAASALLLLSEALVGAGLVLFEYVAQDRSTARIGWMAVHLVNTFALLAALTLTAWWASGGARPRLRGQGALGRLLGATVLATLLVGTTGAITALGDTLYPKTEVGLTLPAAASLLERLRLVHPLVAIATAVLAVLTARIAARRRPGAAVRRLAAVVSGAFALQVAAGAINIALLAPVWMQLLHLLLADAVWISLVCLVAAALGDAAAEAGEASAGAMGSSKALAGSIHS